MADAVPHPPEIDGYEFQEILGSGGFSDVYRYRQRFPRRSVAIKVLHATTADRQSRHQFIAEANAMARLSNHPAIATIFDAGVTADDRPYLIMEFCSRGSLGATYRQNPLPVDQVLRIGVRVATALESAHRLGIVHRDVKPANILITDYGAAVLTDFGISVGDGDLAEATVLRVEQTTTVSLSDGSTHGLSVPWAPPEALDDEPVIDARSDVYSLGATLFSLVEGRSPFEVAGGSNGILQLSRRIERGAIVPGERVAASPDLAAALGAAMAVDPAERPESALAFARWLTGVEAALGLPKTPIELLGDTLDAGEPEPVIEALEATRMRTAAPIETPVWSHGGVAVEQAAKVLATAPDSSDSQAMSRSPMRSPGSVVARRVLGVLVGLTIVAVLIGVGAWAAPRVLYSEECEPFPYAELSPKERGWMPADVEIPGELICAGGFTTDTGDLADLAFYRVDEGAFEATVSAFSSHGFACPDPDWAVSSFVICGNGTSGHEPALQVFIGIVTDPRILAAVGSRGDSILQVELTARPTSTS